jgi:(p)ppGpp synthase/HD superfamily hydrolase
VPFQEPETASKLTTMLLAMADVRAVLVALAARLARLRSAAALAGDHFAALHYDHHWQC